MYCHMRKIVSSGQGTNANFWFAIDILKVPFNSCYDYISRHLFVGLVTSCNKSLLETYDDF
jgi:hypothetical protein